MNSNDHTTIRMLHGDVEAADGLLDSLAAVLADAVEDNASVGFLASASGESMRDYWRACLDGARSRERVVFVAERAGWVAGTVQLVFASQQNAPHRAEVQRLLVHRDARREGLGTRLMRALETEALRHGRWLLFLNTRAGDPPEHLYRRLGYEIAGRIPDFAMNPDGSLNDTTLMFKRLR